MPYRHVMVWAGLRGAISLALVLTITTEYFERDVVDTVQAMTFGVVLFTLLIQGTTIATLMNRLGLSGKADNELTQQRYQARIHMSQAGRAEVQRLGAEGVCVIVLRAQVAQDLHHVAAPRVVRGGDCRRVTRRSGKGSWLRGAS